MGELNQLMLEMEEQLEEALNAMECGWPTQDQINIIRHACGKPRKNKVLTNLFNDFGDIFGGNHASK